jgi:hypothetical protein
LADLFGMGPSANTVTAEDASEFKIPLILLLSGLAIIAAYGLVMAGPQGAMAFITGQMVTLMIMIPLGIVACFLTAKLMGISFGLIRTACVKLAAIFTLPSAIALLIPWTPVAWLASVILYLGLLTWLFELDGWEPVVCAVVIWLVRLAALVLAGIVLSGM